MSRAAEASALSSAANGSRMRCRVLCRQHPGWTAVPVGKFKSRHSHVHRRNRPDLYGKVVDAGTDARPFLGPDAASASRSEQRTVDLNRPSDGTIERPSMSESRKSGGCLGGLIQECLPPKPPSDREQTRSVLAEFLDELPDRESVETVRLLESIWGSRSRFAHCRIRANGTCLATGRPSRVIAKRRPFFMRRSGGGECGVASNTPIPGTVRSLRCPLPVHASQTRPRPNCMQSRLSETGIVRRASRRSVPCSAILNSLLPHHA